jgi:hypothetical protein
LNIFRPKVAICSRHFRDRDGELAKSGCRLHGAHRHPIQRVEVTNLPYDLAFRGKLRCVEEGWPADPGPASQGGWPELLDADADRGDDAESCNDRLSFHRLPLPGVAGSFLPEIPAVTLAGVRSPGQVPDLRLLE